MVVAPAIHGRLVLRVKVKACFISHTRILSHSDNNIQSIQNMPTQMPTDRQMDRSFSIYLLSTFPYV